MRLDVEVHFRSVAMCVVSWDAVDRTRDDVDCTLQTAKLEADELHKTVQCLYMSPHMDNDALKLIEVDNSLLDSLLNGHW